MSSWPDFEATFPSGPPRPGSPDRPPGTADIAANWDPSAAPQPDPDCSLFPSRKFRGARTGDPHALGARAWASKGRSRARGSRRGGRVHPGRPGLWSGKPGSPLSNSGGSAQTLFGAEPPGQGAGVRPGREVARGTLRTRVRNALQRAEERASRAPGPAPRRARGSGAAPTYFLLLHEAHEGGPLDLHGLALSVVEGQDEVEEVGFPQVGRRLLLKVSPGQTHPAAAKEAELDG